MNTASAPKTSAKYVHPNPYLPDWDHGSTVRACTSPAGLLGSSGMSILLVSSPRVPEAAPAALRSADSVREDIGACSGVFACDLARLRLTWLPPPILQSTTLSAVIPIYSSARRGSTSAGAVIGGRVTRIGIHNVKRTSGVLRNGHQWKLRTEKPGKIRERGAVGRRGRGTELWPGVSTLQGVCLGARVYSTLGFWSRSGSGCSPFKRWFVRSEVETSGLILVEA
ncbi:hypothetical protein VTK26DRAFT_5898 [Humicola hyalothermophila]